MSALLKVGDLIWAVPYSQINMEKPGFSVPVAKVGRRWLWVDYRGHATPLNPANLHINYESRESDGVYAEFYANEEAFIAARLKELLGRAWTRLRSDLPYTIPDAVDLEWIAAARAIMGLPE